jgi:hypothetical protein
MRRDVSSKYLLSCGIHDTKADWIIASATSHRIIMQHAEIVAHFMSHHGRRKA